MRWTFLLPGQPLKLPFFFKRGSVASMKKKVMNLSVKLVPCEFFFGIFWLEKTIRCFRFVLSIGLSPFPVNSGGRRFPKSTIVFGAANDVLDMVDVVAIGRNQLCNFIST